MILLLRAFTLPLITLPLITLPLITLPLLHFPFYRILFDYISPQVYPVCACAALAFSWVIPCQQTVATEMYDNIETPHLVNRYYILTFLGWVLFSVVAVGFCIGLIAVRGFVINEERVCREKFQEIYEDVKDQGIPETVFQAHVDATCTNIESNAPLVGLAVETSNSLMLGGLMILMMNALWGAYVLLEHLPYANPSGSIVYEIDELNRQRQVQKSKQS